MLILQIEGSKAWRVYGPEADVPPRLLPLRDRFSIDSLPKPSDLLLEAGDVLDLLGAAGGMRRRRRKRPRST